MRFHYTRHLSDAQRTYAQALFTYEHLDEADPQYTEREAFASRRLANADKLFFNADAFTPSEIRTKVEAAAARGLPITDYYSVEALTADLQRLELMAVSPAMMTHFEPWREAEIAFNAVADGEDASMDTAVDTRFAAFERLMKVDCTSVGDFILKRYTALLHRLCGCTDLAARRQAIANIWDPNIGMTDCDMAASGPEGVELRSAYEDIEQTDVGANLMTYGLPYFCAKSWLETAEWSGHSVSLIEQRDGTWMIGQSMQYRVEGVPHLDRVRDRLLRILAFPYGVDRFRILADEIRRSAPDLILRQPNGGAA